MSYNNQQHDSSGRGNLSQGMANMRITTGSSHSYSSGEASSSSNQIIRKVDEEWRHYKLPPRPESGVQLPICVGQTKMPVLANWFKLNAPKGLRVHSYNVTYTKTSWNEQVECTKKEKTAEAFWHIVDQHPRYFPESVKKGLIFDDVHRVYTLEKLDIPGEFRGTVKMRSRDADGKENAPTPQRGKGGGRGPPEMGFLIVPTGILEVADLKSQSLEDKATTTMLIDLILSQYQRNPTMKRYRLFIQSGHSFYKIPPANTSSSECVPIGNGQEVWMGLHTAVKNESNGIFLNANTSSSIFYKRDINVLEFLTEIIHGYNMPKNIDLQHLTIDNWHLQNLEKVLKGTKILFKSPGMQAARPKKVFCLTRVAATHLRFTMEDGSRPSVAEYFYNQGYPLKAPNLQCIEVKATMRGKSNAYLPLEFCTIGPDPMKYKGRVSDQQLAALIKAASRPAEAKRRDIMRLVKADGVHVSGRDPYMEEFGVSVEREMITVDAKVLQKPNITMLHERMVQVDPNDDTKKQAKVVATNVAPNPESVHDITHVDTKGNVVPSQPYEPSRFKFFPIFTWVKSSPGQARMTPAAVREAGCKMMQTLRAYGLCCRVEVTVLDECNVLHPGEFNAYMDRMKEGFNRQYGNEENKDVRPLYVWVFNQKHRESYEAIKYMCDIRRGVVSQCILAKNLQNIMTGNPVTNNTSTNVMHKVMAKCGSIPYLLDKVQYGTWRRVTNKDEPTLFLAIDVSHPGMEERKEAEFKKYGASKKGVKPTNPPPRAPLDRKKAYEEFSFADCPRSLLAVVGNVDIEAMRYEPSCRVVRLGMEVSVHIKELFRERIKAFMLATGRKPAHVIVYRDGVSGGEFQKVGFEEGGALDDALKELEIEKVTVGILCAQKRHHTRFFPKDLRQVVGEHGNLPPGTLLEDPQVVSRTLFDFFLQSHHGKVGTARPTHYTVLKDTWAPSPAFWQTLANGHAYGYIRCPFAIALPAPLQYAHLAAKKAKGHFDAFRNPNRNFAPEEYLDPRHDDFYRESLEEASVKIHENIREIRGMTFV